jgi:hypothetical protein
VPCYMNVASSYYVLKHVCFIKRMYIILTFVGPCIVIYFYSKTNKMHNISNLFYFGTTLYMFRTVFPPIIRSLRLSVLFCSVLFCSVLFCSVLSRPVLSCPVLSCSVLFCPVLSCPVLSCSFLFCSVAAC